MIEILNLENIIPLELVYALDAKAVRAVMQDVVDGARAYWIQEAGKEFHTTKSEYIAGIQEVDWISPDTAVISLVGMLPNILEQGMDSKDLHDTLLGPNVPVAPLGQKGKHPRVEGGFYRAIPFRHRTPGSGAHGAPMGSAYKGALGEEGAKKLGQDVYKAAKKLAPTISDPYSGQTKWGERLDTGSLGVPKLQPYHATDIYSGMVKQQKSYGAHIDIVNKPQSGYATFRTISVDAAGKGVGSSPWVRPRTNGRFLAKRVAEYVGTRLAPQAFQAYVDGLR